jgi:outer membrane murein-binding lipoprotein Lpp
MARFAAIVIFAGAVVLSTHMLARARTPRVTARPVRVQDLAARLDQTSSVVTQMNAQVEKLRKRLAPPPAYPAPTRDPFRYGKPIEPARPKPAAPVAPALVVPAEPPAPVLPRLVAITSNVVDGATVRSAVLAVGDDVHVFKVGDVVSPFEIHSIALDVVELIDSSTGATFKISLQQL